jgi:hypothetical protein
MRLIWSRDAKKEEEKMHQAKRKETKVNRVNVGDEALG